MPANHLIPSNKQPIQAIKDSFLDLAVEATAGNFTSRSTEEAREKLSVKSFGQKMKTRLSRENFEMSIFADAVAAAGARKSVHLVPAIKSHEN